MSNYYNYPKGVEKEGECPQDGNYANMEDQ